MALVGKYEWIKSCKNFTILKNGIFRKIPARRNTEVTAERDIFGLALSRKAIVLKDTALHSSGLRKHSQLAPFSQNIFKKTIGALRRSYKLSAFLDY